MHIRTDAYLGRMIMKKQYITPLSCWGPAIPEDCLLAASERSGNSGDMGYEDVPGVIWTF